VPFANSSDARMVWHAIVLESWNHLLEWLKRVQTLRECDLPPENSTIHN